MARERMVTRTIETFEVEATTAFPKAMAMDVRYYDVPGHIKESMWFKYIREAYTTDEMVPVSLTGKFYKTSQVYGMPENEFISLAKILDR